MLRPYVIKTQEIYMHMKCWLHRILESFTMHITMLIIRCLYIEKYLHVWIEDGFIWMKYQTCLCFYRITILRPNPLDPQLPDQMWRRSPSKLVNSISHRRFLKKIISFFYTCFVSKQRKYTVEKQNIHIGIYQFSFI